MMRSTRSRFSRAAWVLGITVAALSASTTACIGGKKQLSAEERERIAPYVLDAVPEGATKIDVNFENKVHLVGYKVEPALAPPRTPVKLTLYWRADGPVGDGWQLFTHVQHEGIAKSENLDANGPLRQIENGRPVFGPDRWERGKIYADEQTFTMPAELRGPESTVFVGLWRGDSRLRVLSGPTSGDNRAIVTKIQTGVAKKVDEKHGKNDVPSLEAGKLAAGEKIVVDGKGDEPAWRAAAGTGPFVNVRTGDPADPHAVTGSAKLLWDDAHLYALIEVKDTDVVGYFTDKASQPKDWTAGGQPMTWTKHTAEIMIDPDGDGDNKDYYELQINPQNKGFHSQFDGYNTPKVEPQGPFGHEDWDPKLTSAVVVHGTIDDDSDRDEGYTVEVAIPWSAFEKGAKNRPPKPGDAWRMNFYSMESNGGTSWSPILGQGNFHKASRFGRVVWTTPEWLADKAKGATDAGAPSTADRDASAATKTLDGGALERIRDRAVAPRLVPKPKPAP